MKNATISLNSNESEPKHHPIEVLRKNQNQGLPEDVNPAKKEVCSRGLNVGDEAPHRLKHQAQEMTILIEHLFGAMTRQAL